MRWLVVLYNAAGSRREHRCWASSETAACNVAARTLKSETGERWYPSVALEA